MFTFTHTTEATFDKKPENLPASARLSQRGEGSSLKYVVHIDEELTVPQTVADFVKLDGATTENISCGGKKVTVPQPVADYIRGRKLRSNQDQQQVIRGAGVSEKRGDALAAWSRVDVTSAMASVVAAAKSKDYAKVHNARLDRIMAEPATMEVEVAAAKKELSL